MKFELNEHTTSSEYIDSQEKKTFLDKNLISNAQQSVFMIPHHNQGLGMSEQSIIRTIKPLILNEMHL